MHVNQKSLVLEPLQGLVVVAVTEVIAEVVHIGKFIAFKFKFCDYIKLFF